MGSRRVHITVLASAVALLAAACGGTSSSSSGGDTTAPVRNATTANAISVPTYRVVSSGLTPTQIAAVNKALDPYMPTGVDVTVDPIGRLGYADTGALLVGTKQVTGAATTGQKTDDERADGTSGIAWDPSAVNALQPMSTTAITTLVTNAAATLKQGDTGALVKPGPVTLEMYSPSSKSITLNKQIATAAARTSKLGGYPLVGPGNSFDLLVGGTGKLAFVNIQQRSYAVGANVQVPTGADAVNRCKSVLEGTKTGSTSGYTLTASLVYFSPALSEKISTIEPALKCDGTAGDGSTLRTMYITARIDIVASILSGGIALTPRVVADLDSLGLELGTSYRASNARSALRNTAPSTQDFENAMTTWGMDLRVDYNDATPDTAFASSTDSAAGGADTVDMFWYTGHANGNGWQTDGGQTNTADLRLGNSDLEWLVVAACGPFQDSTGAGSWQSRLTPMFQGLHLLMAYATTSSDTAGEGASFATYSTTGGFPPLVLERPSLVAAWIYTAMDNQDAGVRWGIGGVQSSTFSSLGDCFLCAEGDIRPSDTGFTMWRLVGQS